MSGFWYSDCVLKMCMLDEIRARRDEIYAFARKHKAEKLWVGTTRNLVEARRGGWG